MARGKETSRNERLRQARATAGLRRAQLAERTGYSVSAVGALENGQNDLRPEVAELFAPVLKTTAAWLLTGAGPDSVRKIPIVGYVGAGSELSFFDDYAQGAGLEEIDAPPGSADNAVAVVVRGDSGYPLIRDGMTLVYWNRYEDPSQLVGENCFVRLDDGRVLVKIIEPGTEPGRWTLASINAATPPIRNVKIEWAAPIEVMLRSRNWRGET